MVDRDDTSQELLGIGEFALASGLSVPRLRRYHEEGLLIPSKVNPSTGYRTYSADQLSRARAIRRLRQLDVPIEDLAAALDGEPALRTRVLESHRLRLQEHLETTRQVIELLDQVIRKEQLGMTSTSAQLVEVVLHVDDVEATCAFYRDVMGFEFEGEDHRGAEPFHYHACGGTWNPEGFFLFTIFPAAGSSPATRARIGFGIPDVDDVWERAKAHGATEIAAPSDSGYMPRSAVFSDPAGNRVQLYQRSGAW